jgi:hypothetical protein
MMVLVSTTDEINKAVAHAKAAEEVRNVKSFLKVQK